MKIAFLSPFSSSAIKNFIQELNRPGIPEGMGGTAVFELVKGLIETGVDINILTLQPGLDDIKYYHNNNLHYYIIPRRLKGSTRDFWLNERRLIKNILKKIKPDVVHAHWTYEYALSALQYNPNKTLVTAHDIPFKVLKYSRSIYYLPLFLSSIYVYKIAKNIACVSDSVKKYVEKFVSNNCLIEVIPNIIDLSNYNINDIQFDFLPKNYFISVGLWNNLKNLKNSIKAFNLFQKQYNDYYYVLIGPGLSLGSNCEDWIKKKGLSKNIILLGKQPRIKTLAILSKAKALIHPSLTEANPMIIGEAMGLGIPVIAGNNSGGATELISQRRGFPCDIKNPLSIYQIMKCIIENRNEVNIITKNAKEYIESNFNSIKIIKKYIEWYKKIMN